jgi:hypothetical protein
MKCNKFLMKQIKAAEYELMEGSVKWLDIVMCSSIIALSRYWGWKKDRLSKLQKIQEDAWNEVANDNNKSMVQVLDEECGIELTNHEGVSYKDVIYLNASIDPGVELNPYQYLAMRQNQAKWTEAQITACVILAMHRKEGWGFNRSRELLERMQQIKEEYDYDREKLIAAALSECDIDWTGRGKLNG